MSNIDEILKNSKVIAVVGLSDKEDRPSFQVARYLINEGFKIIPVNPTIENVLGLKSYPNLSSIPAEIKIDIVDVFRKSEDVLPVIQEVISLGQKPVIWLQEGISNPEAENLAKENGLEVIGGICLMKAHQR